MLVLSRRVNQSIKIGDDIEIMIVEVRGDQVRLGVKAPRGVAVHREEIYFQIQQENVKAAEASASNDALVIALENLLQQDSES